MLNIQIITLFPEMFDGVLGTSMLWKASDKQLVTYTTVDLRQFGKGPRRQVDDTPYGGGDGMLLMVDPLVQAIEHCKNIDSTALVYLPTPRGDVYKQSQAKTIASDGRGIIVVCPRYEGYDERITRWVDVQYRIGNYVLTGGEVPAMVLIDSVVRLIPGVLGGAESVAIESFQDDDESIEFPQYTRPASYRGLDVPGVLLQGHHAEIELWRHSSK